MQTCDVLVVGGGPAGSSTAWKLKAAGADVLVLDREAFPRVKLCAGWITPEVVSDLEMNVADYPHRFLTFRRLHFHVKGLNFAVPSVQHSIRRYEFDAWLLERSRAPVVRHNVRHIRREPGGYVVDDAFRCRWIVGAGGTSCPVYRTFFRDVNPRAKELQAVALEHELAFDWRDPDCHLWFFDKGLPGYSWYVPKADGWVNLGVGGMASRLKQRGEDIKQHWSHFAQVVGRDLAKGAVLDPSGYSYWLLGNVDVVRVDDAFITGDAAGLATRDMCEGIGPAIRSGLRAAQSILTGRDYDLSDVTGASLGGGLVTRAVDWAFTRGVGRRGRSSSASAAVTAAS